MHGSRRSVPGGGQEYPRPTGVLLQSSSDTGLPGCGPPASASSNSSFFRRLGSTARPMTSIRPDAFRCDAALHVMEAQLIPAVMLLKAAPVIQLILAVPQWGDGVMWSPPGLGKDEAFFVRSSRATRSEFYRPAPQDGHHPRWSGGSNT